VTQNSAISRNYKHSRYKTTRSSADADKPAPLRDAFIGQSRSPNIVPFHILGSFLLCNSNLSLRRGVFDIRLQKCRDLEIGVRGHSRSLKVFSPFDRLCTVSY